MADIVDLKSWRARQGGATTDAPSTTSTPREPLGGYESLVKVEAKPGINADDVSAAMMSAMVSHMTGSVDLKNRLAGLISRNEQKINQYREMVSGYSKEQISGFLKATDAEIMRKPYFYYAIADEAERRLGVT